MTLDIIHQCVSQATLISTKAFCTTKTCQRDGMGALWSTSATVLCFTSVCPSREDPWWDLHLSFAFLFLRGCQNQKPGGGREAMLGSSSEKSHATWNTKLAGKSFPEGVASGKVPQALISASTTVLKCFDGAKLHLQPESHVNNLGTSRLQFQSD